MLVASDIPISSYQKLELPRESLAKNQFIAEFLSSNSSSHAPLRLVDRQNCLMVQDQGREQGSWNFWSVFLHLPHLPSRELVRFVSCRSNQSATIRESSKHLLVGSGLWSKKANNHTTKRNRRRPWHWHDSWQIHKTGQVKGQFSRVQRHGDKHVEGHALTGEPWTWHQRRRLKKPLRIWSSIYYAECIVENTLNL